MLAMPKFATYRILFSPGGNRPPGMTDEDLLAEARRGGEDAFRALYERYRDPLFRLAYRLTGSAPLSEDLVHDCFVSLLGKGFQAARGALRPYIYATIRNLVHKHFRDHRREEPTGDFDCNASEQPGPLGDLISRETAAEVRAAVGELPLLQREVLVLFEYEQISLAAIAAMVEADLSAVKSRLHRARESLRKKLDPTVYSRGDSHE